MLQPHKARSPKLGRTNQLQKNPETDIQKFDVEVGIVTAFICNLERKGDGDYEDEIYDLLVELREVADNVESKMRAIWKGLGYQGNHMNVASTAKDNQDNR